MARWRKVVRRWEAWRGEFTENNILVTSGFASRTRCGATTARLATLRGSERQIGPAKPIFYSWGVLACANPLILFVWR